MTLVKLSKESLKGFEPLKIDGQSLLSLVFLSRKVRTNTCASLLMSHYITCKYCGVEEKGMYPPCECRETRLNDLLSKIVGATICSCCMMDGILYTTYQKDAQIICTMTILETYKHECYETFTEITSIPPQPF